MINRRLVFSYDNSAVVQYLPKLSILKCPENYSMPPTMIGHYPYFFDFKSEESKEKKGILSYSSSLSEKPKIEDYQLSKIPDHISQNDEDNRIFNQTLCLVNAICSPTFFTYDSRQHWTIVLDDTHAMFYGQEGYSPPDEHVNQLNEMTEIPNHHFIEEVAFTLISESQNSQRQDVKVSELFEKFYANQNTDLSKKYINACMVLSKSFKLVDIDTSASYIFLVAALEALIDIEYADFKVENCPSCGQPKYKVSAKFKKFIDKYGYPVDSKTKNEFYGLRSKIAHSGQLLGMSYDYKWAIESQEDMDLKYKSSIDRVHYDSFNNLVKTCFKTFLYANY